MPLLFTRSMFCATFPFNSQLDKRKKIITLLFIEINRINTGAETEKKLFQSSIQKP